MRKLNILVFIAISCLVLPLSQSWAQTPKFRTQLNEHWLKQLKVKVTKIDKKTARRKHKGIQPEQDAAGAVDGKRLGSKSRFHTNKERVAWWQVDLGRAFPISKIIVANRDHCENRANRLEILFSVNNKNWKPVYTHDNKLFRGGVKGTKPLEIKFVGQAKYARYVRLQVRNNYLHLNEVEVYSEFNQKKNIALGCPATQSSTHSMSTLPGEVYNGPAPADTKDSKGTATAGDIQRAFELAKRTLAFVEKSKKQPQLARQLTALEAKWKKGSIKAAQYDNFYCQVRYLRRQIILTHPALNFEKILINRTPPTKYSHNGDQHQGGHSRVGPGLTILTEWKTDQPKAKAILKGKLPAGAVRNPDLNYDAKKVAFAYCDHTQPGHKRYFLYEAAIDGSWVRQLTGTKRDSFKTWDNRATALIEDNDPCYLPNGDLIFISTRSQTYGRCHGGRYNPAWVLYRCDKDGNKIRQLSYGNENEYEPAILNDGRVIFCRWEYTNRHEMLFHMLWWCRPDGTQITHFYGNDTLHPMMVSEATPIPGTHKVVATAMGHHSYTTGTVVVIDTDKGENDEEPITHITPETPYSETHGWPEPHYSHPYPINEDLFLVSRANHRVHKQGQVPPPADRAIYLVDTLGGRELIYEDPTVASFSPIPIRKRKVPPMMPSMIQENAPEQGTLFVQNAYLTRNDPEKKIKPGSIKAIRVIALGVQPRRRRSPCSATVRVEIPKKILGTVPVNENGSAWFKAPAKTALQLQLLDKTGRAILTEKTFFYLQPGENRSCVGCHEPVGTSPQTKTATMLRKMRPMDLTPPAGPKYKGGLSFMRTVQPVLDRYCIGCHGLAATKKGVNLIHDGKLVWPRPYLELLKRGQHKLGDKGYMWDKSGEGRNISRPYRYYAHANKVSDMLLKNHGKVNMDRNSYMRIIEWMDVNAQCYGDLFPYKIEERRIDAKALAELRNYVKTLFGATIAAQPERALINTAQPDESRILMAPLLKSAGGWGQIPGGYRSKSDPKYQKMKQLIDRCIVKNRNENDNGWQPSLTTGGGDGWVVKERQTFTKRVLGKALPVISSKVNNSQRDPSQKKKSARNKKGKDRKKSKNSEK